MSKLNIAVLFGGFSLEHEVSILSFKNIVSALDLDKYNILPIYITKNGEWFLYEGSLSNLPNSPEKFGTPITLSLDKTKNGLIRIIGDKLKHIRIDIALPIIHGNNGEDGSLQGLLEIAGIPYVGCGVLSSSVCMDKSFTNLIAIHHDIPIIPSIVLKEKDISIEEDLEDIADQIKENLGYPCFIKPANGGSSVGANKAKNKKQVIEALREAFKCDHKVLVQKYIKAKEVECAALDTPDGLKISIVGEVSVASSGEFYGYEEKFHNPESTNIIPAKIKEDISEKIRTFAATLFTAVDGRGLARLDFFLENKTNQIYFNEINTLPGFTNASMYPLLAQTLGYELKELLDLLIEGSLS